MTQPQTISIKEVTTKDLQSLAYLKIKEMRQLERTLAAIETELAVRENDTAKVEEVKTTEAKPTE